MAGKTPAEAVKAFIGPIQDALGLFASGKVTADTYKPDVLGLLVFNGGEVVKLANKVGLRVTMQYRIAESDDAVRGPWKVRTAGYMYGLRVDGEKLYDYHWHPISKSHEERPHLHCAAVGKSHVPTGRVMIEDVLNLAIELGAEPNDRTRWKELDQLNREKFARGATWGVGPT